MLLRFTLLAFCAIGLVAGGEEHVLELTDADFDRVIDSQKTTLVMFYAPWCGHCKKLKPQYAEAAELVANDDPPIALAKVDCTEGGKETCSRFQVNGYPTLKIFRGVSSHVDYNGPREANGIAKYMRAQVGPASKEIKSAAAYDELKNPDGILFGAFKDPSSALAKAFQNFAEKERETYTFAHSNSADVLEKLGETDAVLIIRPPHLHNKFEDAIVKIEGSSQTDIHNFVRENFHGLAGHRTQDTARDFRDPLIVVYFDIDYTKNPKGAHYWRNRVLKVAREFAGQITFAISSKEDYRHELSEYGYEFVGEKPVVAGRDAKGLKYRMDGEFSVENLHTFAKNLLAGELEPYIKSEPVPESNDAPVKIAVAKNFDELVINNGKDTLIEFYAPWCGHCKKLTPIYDELAEKLKDEDVVIAKMDATANDVPPEYNVRGFPTLKWLRKDAKNKPVDYNAGRELDDFIKFIAKEATNELKSYDRSGNLKKTEL